MYCSQTISIIAMPKTYILFYLSWLECCPRQLFIFSWAKNRSLCNAKLYLQYKNMIPCCYNSFVICDCPEGHLHTAFILFCTYEQSINLAITKHVCLLKNLNLRILICNDWHLNVLLLYFVRNLFFNIIIL